MMHTINKKILKLNSSIHQPLNISYSLSISFTFNQILLSNQLFSSISFHQIKSSIQSTPFIIPIFIYYYLTKNYSFFIMIHKFVEYLEQPFKFIYNILYYPVLIIITLILIIAILLLLFQNKLLYMPQMGDQMPRSQQRNPHGYRNPAQQKLSYQQISITTEDAQILKGWLILTDNPKQSRTICYFHQNAGNIGFRIHYLKAYKTYTNSNILLVAYRGFSQSSGSPSEQGLKKDGLAILRFLLKCDQINTQLIYLHGRSLGGAVTAYVAAQDQFKNKIKGIILENTFTCISDMVDVVMSFARYFKPFVLRNYWETYKMIPKISAPILFIKAMRDQLVPVKQMNRLSELAKEHDLKNKQYCIQNGTHNSTWQLNPKQYFDTIVQFFGQECGQAL